MQDGMATKNPVLVVKRDLWLNFKGTLAGKVPRNGFCKGMI